MTPVYHRPIGFAIDELMLAASGEQYLLFKGFVIDKSTWKDLLDADPGLQPLGPLLHELPDPPKRSGLTEEELARRRATWAQEEDEGEDFEDAEEGEEMEESDEEAEEEEKEEEEHDEEA